jgi:hypothetical protein
MQWLVAALCLEVFDRSDHALAANNLAEDDVFLVEMGCGDGRDEELRAVGA